MRKEKDIDRDGKKRKLIKRGEELGEVERGVGGIVIDCSNKQNKPQ